MSFKFTLKFVLILINLSYKSLYQKCSIIESIHFQNLLFHYKRKNLETTSTRTLLKISFFHLFAVVGKSYEVKINFKPCFYSYVATISGEQ